MRKNSGRVLVLVILSALLVGCLNFGNNYSNDDGQKPPLKEIGNWLGLPLPNNYSALKYKIIADTPDKNVQIAVKVPEDFVQNLIKSQNLVNYDKFKDKLSYDLNPRELLNTDNSNSILKKPLSNTTIWLKKADGRRQMAEGSLLLGILTPTSNRTPCRRWGFIPLWQRTDGTEGITYYLQYLFLPSALCPLPSAFPR